MTIFIVFFNHFSVTIKKSLSRRLCQTHEKPLFRTKIQQCLQKWKWFVFNTEKYTVSHTYMILCNRFKNVVALIQFDLPLKGFFKKGNQVVLVC